MLDVDARGCWAAGKAAGWEKLKPPLVGFVLGNKPVDVDVAEAETEPNGELDMVVVVGSGLALIIGLKSASFDGLKLNSETKPLL